MTEQSPAIGAEFEHLENDVADMASIFNLSDIATRVRPGQGWSCEAVENQGLNINVDPEQIAADDGSIDEDKVLFVSRHELQHANDMLDPDWKYQPDLRELSQTDSLFWNFTHDITIDGRTVKDYKKYRKVAPELYEQVFKNLDARKDPKHIQFMKGLRFQSVLGKDSKLKIDTDVQETIDQLRNHDGHDLTKVLTHKGTSLRQRIALAEKFFKPEYDKFVEQEQQNNSEQDMEQQASDAMQQADMTQSGSNSENEDSEGESQKTFEEQLEDATEEYKASSQGENGEETEDEQEGGQSGEEDEEGGGSDSGENEADEQGGESEGDKQGNFLSQAIKKLMEAVSNNDEKSEQEQDSPEEPEESLEEVINKLGGTVKQELGLHGADAMEYARALVIHRPLIVETANIFQRLARIDEVQSRMVPTRQALPEGERLHTGRLPQAFIQGETDIPMDIWRGKKREAPKIVRQFNGLDVQLLVDASMSMNGSPAIHAAEMSLVLSEGLLLARYEQAKEIQGKLPDVRLNSMIFAGDTETIMPLSLEPSGADRASLYTNTKRAGQWNTLVNPGIRKIFDNARENPDRDIIGIVISDNEFGDEPRNLMFSKPENCLVWNFSLNNGDAIGVGRYATSINNTAQLPAKLLEILQYYESQFYE